MISKVNSLNKFILNGSNLLIKTSSVNLTVKPTTSRFYSNNLNFLLNKKITSTNQLKLNTNLPKTCFNLNLKQSFHASLNLNQTNDKKTIINSQPTKSILSDDLKNIMEKKFGESEPQQQQEKQHEQQKEHKKETSNEQEPKGFARMFSREHAWKFSLGFFTILFGGSFFYVLVYWGSPKLDDNKQPIKDEFSSLPILIQYPRRAFQAVLEFYQMIKDPSVDKLLPDPIQPPYYQPPYTLVIEMTGILLHPEWTFSNGWRFKKRPGLDYFIDQIKYPQFEVVLFTREPFLSGAPIAASLDPEQKIHHKLFRECTKYMNKSYVKDLSYLNRDLSKIIVIDWDENAYQLQSRNALHRLKKWEGDENDTDLVYLASFLKLIASSNVADVRDVLDFYNKEMNPLEEFKIKQIKLIESEMERKEAEAEAKKKKVANFSLFKR